MISSIGNSTERKSGVTGSSVSGRKHRRRRERAVGIDVVPKPRQIGFVQDKFRLVRHGISPYR